MLNNLDKIIQDGVNKGLLQNSTNINPLDSVDIYIDEIPYLNFGSCSYLGLEHHDEMKDAVKLAAELYGTQFSTSRTYLSHGLYDTLEQELSKMFDKPVLVASSTTLGHLAALPVIIEDGDAVILDLQVHASVQMSAQILKANNRPIHFIPHNDMDSLEVKIKMLSGKAKRIWYLADGVYSMYGDFAPISKIQKLLNKYDNLFLYIDDAHGMGWTGKNGIGYVRSQMEHHDRMVMITSLNKSFAASGGVLVFPNNEMQRKVKNCGTTIIFSGPIQPPMLGAAIASAKLHQSKQFPFFQDELKSKISFTNSLLMELDLPQYEMSDSPVFFIPVGLPRIIGTIIDRMKKKGYYLNSAGYPATPMKKGGLRFMVTNRQKKEQISEMLKSLKKEYLLGLLSEGSSPAHVANQFKIEPFLVGHSAKHKNVDQLPLLKSITYSSIESLGLKKWNSLFAPFGSNEYQNLKELSQVFKGHKIVENNWDIKYHIIRDSEGELFWLLFIQLH
jgi:7-keto-8-aminopelargonate synthetase-like enzyme